MSRSCRSSLIAVFALLLPLVAAGCLDLFVGPDSDVGRLSLSFGLAATDAASASAAPATPAAVDPRFSTTVTGSAGATMVLHDVRFVVGQFSLERDAGACDGTTSGGDGSCEPFVADPHLLGVSLGELAEGEEIRVSESAPADTYTALEFAVQVPGSGLLADIREQGRQVAENRPDRPKLAFDDWPEGATAFVSGSYDADGPDGTVAPEPFRIFFSGEAGARIEFQEDLPLIVRPGETTEAAILMSRDVWLASEGEEVLDLTQLDYDESGQVYALDPDLIQSFETIEISG